MLSRAEKSKWLKTQFIELSPTLDSTAPFEVNNAWLVGCDKKDFEKWKATFGHTTTARNRLFEMFLTVRSCPECSVVPCV